MLEMHPHVHLHRRYAPLCLHKKNPHRKSLIWVNLFGLDTSRPNYHVSQLSLL